MPVTEVLEIVGIDPAAVTQWLDSLIAGQSGRSLRATVLALVELFERSHQ
jgi:hypothetical protein